MFDADCAGGDCVFDRHHKVNAIVDLISQCDILLLHTRPTARRESYLVDNGRVAFCAYSTPITFWVLPRSRRTDCYLLPVIGVVVAERREHDRP